MQKPKKTFEEIEQEYGFEISRVIETIKKEKAKKVLLQFPDGLKPWATAIHDKIQESLGKNSKTELFLWLGTCFGACDIPLEVEKLGIDLIVQFGHSDWQFSKEKGIKVLR